jgi:regulator of RNase E activity RraA
MRATETSLAARAGSLTTSGLSDAMDRLGIAGQVEGVRPIDVHSAMSGPAFTVRYRSVEVPGETVGDYIDDIPAGSVVVIDNQGRLDCTVWGDILTETASRSGVAGTVIDGTCRDAQSSVDVGYPLFARQNWMRTGKDRVTVAATQGSVVLGGVSVQPGDLVVGDRDGVVVIPAQRAGDVVELAESIEASEAKIREAVRSGQRLDQARESFGYHLLQRRDEAPQETPSTVPASAAAPGQERARA